MEGHIEILKELYDHIGDTTHASIHIPHTNLLTLSKKTPLDVLQKIMKQKVLR